MITALIQAINMPKTLVLSRPTQIYIICQDTTSLAKTPNIGNWNLEFGERQITEGHNQSPQLFN